MFEVAAGILHDGEWFQGNRIIDQQTHDSDKQFAELSPLRHDSECVKDCSREYSQRA